MNYDSNYRVTLSNANIIVEAGSLTGDFQHDINYLSGAIDNVSGQVELNISAIDELSGDFDALPMYFDYVVTSGYVELKQVLESGQYETILVKNDNYIFDENIDTAITVHSNVSYIKGESLKAVLDLDTGNNTNLITALKLHDNVVLDTFTVTNFSDRAAPTTTTPRGYIEGQDDNSRTIVKNMYVEGVVNPSPSLSTGVAVILYCRVANCYIDTENCVRGVYRCKDVYNTVIRRPGRGFSQCTNLSLCEARNEDSNGDPVYGHGFEYCSEISSCYVTRCNNGVYFSGNIVSMYAKECIIGFNFCSGISSVSTSHCDTGYYKCKDFDEVTCRAINNNNDDFIDCTFNHKLHDNIDNTKTINFDIGSMAGTGTSRTFTYPTNSGVFALTDDLLGLASSGDIANLRTDIDTISGDLDTAEDRIADNETDISNIAGRVLTNETDISNIDTRVTTNETDITNIETDISNIETRVTTNETDISNIDTRVTTNETDISNIETDINTLSGDILWKEDTEITPKDDTKNVRVPALSGHGNLLHVDIDGKFNKAGVQVYANALNGSLLGLNSFASNPSAAALVAGDTFIKVKGSGFALTFFDGTDFYSTDLVKE